ncbi:Helicase protein MOM1 [Platanthera zijinensis]|uniref:Helicase protein MOM1 n=1 Tax=Platanthera zijinensis TaxID=2320716 RepID=A0AAP0FU45_9ASPA
MTLNLKPNNLLKPSGEEEYNHESSKINMDSSPSTLEELGFEDNGVCHEEFLRCTDQLMDKENLRIKHNVCLVCKQTGRLICCCGNGCKQSYHLSCFNPRFYDIPPGTWLCKFCVKKKMESGVYSVSNGIESVWDVDEGLQSEKKYFVKYKGLAHVHNRWILESELLQDSPSLLDKFRRRGQKEVTRWRKEWIEPERFLQKRLVGLPKVVDEHTSVPVSHPLNCCSEWLVKWKGLEHDQATWELESSLLLLCSESPRLIEDYERRREHTRRSYDPHRTEKAQQVKKDPLCNLSKLPDGCPVELDSDCLSSVNSLREFWHKSLNAVVIDGHERITRAIMFVLSLQSHACQPSLIITTPGSLQLWQADFRRLAPSMNVIIYQGDKHVRKLIQNVEFYDKSGRLMFQVLLADPKAIVEDLVDITCISWESIIVDNCLNSKTARNLEEINIINANFKLLLLLNGQLKDSISEYRLLLSFLNKGDTVDEGSVGLKADTIVTTVALATLKKKLAHHIAYECEADSSKFLEYWVSVPLSSVQLEQYCEIIVSNANVLRSHSKSDVVEALRNVLITTRKCCDHPYLVDGELHRSLTRDLQGVEFLNAEVCASGKLYLLGKVLQEMKDHGLRVVILFQSLGDPGKVSLGDILDDFLHQRFGDDSYERIENGMIMAKKVAAIENFNSKEAGRFAFLIEKRACMQSVKLRSVDVIVLFDSDWNPINDLRSLQKLSIESQHNSIKVFRLYTSYTVEEKILMLAKQDIILESTVDSINRTTIHSLIGWGASYLFGKLDQLHSSTSPTCISEASFGKFHLNDVVQEIITQLAGEAKTDRSVPCSILVKARVIGGKYSNSIALAGEKEGILLPGKDLPSFWSGLLDGRDPKWIHKSEHSQRIRKRIQNLNILVIQSMKSDGVKNKRQKINKSVDPVTLPAQENSDAPKEAHDSCMVDSESRDHKLEDQRNLLKLLRPELSELCDILGLPESVKAMADQFLFYIMNNHDVCLNQMTLLQALKLSLCWRAASMSRHKLDRIDSLALAKKKLKFECTEMEALSIYSKLKILQDKFPCQSNSLQIFRAASVKNGQSSTSIAEDTGKESEYGRYKERAGFDNSALGVTNVDEETAASDNSALEANNVFPICLQQGHFLTDNSPGKFQLDIKSLKDSPLKNKIDLVDQVFIRRSEDLAQMQETEVSNFEKQMDDYRMILEKLHDLDVEFFHNIHVDSTIINGKIDVLTKEFSTKLGKFYQQLKQQKHKLMSMQLDMRTKEQKLKCSWLAKAKTSKMDESFDDLPRLKTRFILDRSMEACEYADNEYSEGTNLNFAFPSYEENTESNGCLEVPSNILNGLEEIVKLGDKMASTSVIEHIKENYVEPSLLPEQAGRISSPQLEDLAFSSKPSDLPTCCVSEVGCDIEQLEGRHDSNGLHQIHKPELHQDALFLPLEQGLANSVSSSTSSIQELCTDEHDKSFSHEVNLPGTPSIATDSPHLEVTCNGGPPSNFTHCSEAPVHETVEAIDVEIPVNIIHPIRLQEDLPSERTCYGNLVGSDIQQGMVCAWSHPSAPQGEVPVQEPTEDEIENQPTIRQNPANTFHGIGLRLDLPLGRTCSGHPGGSDIQSDQVNQFCQSSSSIEWDPSQVLCTDPMQNELFRVLKQEQSCTNKYENKKLQLKLAYEQESEKLKRKFEALLQGAEREYLSDVMLLRKIYQQVSWHKVFADEVGVEFFNDEEGFSTSFEAPSGNSQQDLQASPRDPSWQPPIQPHPLPLPSAPTASVLASTSPLIPISRPEMSVSTLSGPATPHLSLRVIRAPAPHLQRCRPPAPSTSTSDRPLIPDSSQHSPVCSDPPPLVLPHCSEPDDLLESMLTEFVGHDNIIFLSDDE